MQHTARQVCLPSALLAVFAFIAIWLMAGHFDDDFAKPVIAMAFASWVAVSSGITGFVFL